MKRNLVVCVCLFILTVPVFAQNIDKAQYKAIDPFDYQIEEDTVPRGTEGKYKSVVEFVSEIKEKTNVFYKFISLDKLTPLILSTSAALKAPSPGQTVTVYYTMNKRGRVSVVLDAFEDNKNKNEKELGVEKKTYPSPNIKKSDYRPVTPDEYKDDAFFTQQGDDDRKFYAPLQFVFQEGILYTFSSPDNASEKPILLKMKVNRRYPVFKAGQKMTIYFTASKQVNDHKKIDDIVLMN